MTSTRQTLRNRRSGDETKRAILTAARVRFSADGYERTTMRAIARDVGVDPAMVIRYFDNKQTLFARAVEFDLHLPDLTGVRPEDLGRVLMPSFFRVWENETRFLALLRASASNAVAAETMRRIFADQVEPALSVSVVDHAAERAGLVGSLLLGMTVSRNVVGTTTLVEMSRDELAAWLEPMVTWLLTSAKPGR